MYVATTTRTTTEAPIGSCQSESSLTAELTAGLFIWYTARCWEFFNPSLGWVDQCAHPGLLLLDDARYLTEAQRAASTASEPRLSSHGRLSDNLTICARVPARVETGCARRGTRLSHTMSTEGRPKRAAVRAAGTANRDRNRATCHKCLISSPDVR